MTEKENRPTAATGERAGMETAAGQAAISMSHCNTAAGNGQQKIADLLSRGAENGVPKKHLMALTGYHDRELRLMVEAERKRGIPILADCVHGYFLPASKAEIDSFCRSMRGRAAEIVAVANAVEKAAGRMVS